MGKLSWAGRKVALSATLLLGMGQTASADIQSDRAAAIVVYPHIEVGASVNNDTVIRLSNANQSNAILAHCFYVNANSHCAGGSNSGQICNDNPGICTGGLCTPGWQETDFRIRLTPSQPIQWLASEGLAGDDLPIPAGYCVRNPQRFCASDSDCNPFPGGECTDSNVGTRIPPVAETPFQGDLRCIAINDNGLPASRNDLKGEALLEVVRADSTLDVASYNAIGIQSTGATAGSATELIIGGANAEYNGCPNYLILDHFFDTARDPIPGTNNTITTELVMVPCSNDYNRQISGSATAQFLVFNEFEQRFSTSKPVRCYDRTQLCRIGTTQCANSVFNVAVAGTLTGQTRINPIRGPRDAYGAGLLGVAIERHDGTGGADTRAAFNLNMHGARAEADTIIIPEP